VERVLDAVRRVTERRLFPARSTLFHPQNPIFQEYEPMNITTTEAANLIRNSNGQFFTATFTKRSDGTLRTMNCRTGVTRHLHGGELSFNPAEKGLLIVFDAQKQGYRCIPLESITRLAISGQQYDVAPEHVMVA
jgi:hypothetical protein